MFDRTQLQAARRIVVKVGTSTLTHPNGKLNFRHIDRLARVMCDLQNAGREMVFVTSGAIGVGANKLGLKTRPTDIPTRQAAAASFCWLALPAVTTPPSSGLSAPRLSIVASARIPSSRAKTMGSPRFCGTAIGTNCASK